MKIRVLVFTMLAAILIVVPLPVKALDAGDLIDYFVDSLSSYGRWVNDAPYGRVWEPYRQDSGWRPYSNGRWVYTDYYGWVWQPADQFGEIPYRYGRWFHRAGRWFWVPDRVWGPAWVDWRYSDDYVGWAPLPPDDDWRFDEDRWRHEWRPSYYQNRFEPDRYVFVPSHNLTAPDVRRYEVPIARNQEILRRSRPITVYRRDEQNRVRNEGPRREAIERAAGRRIESVRIEPKEVRRRDNRGQAAARKEQERQPDRTARNVPPERREPGREGRGESLQPQMGGQRERPHHEPPTQEQTRRKEVRPREQPRSEARLDQPDRQVKGERDARNREAEARNRAADREQKQQAVGRAPGAGEHHRGEVKQKKGRTDRAPKPAKHGQRDSAHKAKGAAAPERGQGDGGDGGHNSR